MADTRVTQLRQGGSGNQLNLVDMVEDGDLLLQELLHRVAEANTTAEVFVVGVGHFAENGCSSSLCNLAQDLSRNLVACGAEEDPLKIVLETKVCNQPLLEERAHVCRK